MKAKRNPLDEDEKALMRAIAGRLRAFGYGGTQVERWRAASDATTLEHLIKDSKAPPTRAQRKQFSAALEYAIRLKLKGKRTAWTEVRRKVARKYSYTPETISVFATRYRGRVEHRLTTASGGLDERAAQRALERELEFL